MMCVPMMMLALGLAPPAEATETENAVTISTQRVQWVEFEEKVEYQFFREWSFEGSLKFEEEVPNPRYVWPRTPSMDPVWSFMTALSGSSGNATQRGLSLKEVSEKNRAKQFSGYLRPTYLLKSSKDGSYATVGLGAPDKLLLKRFELSEKDTPLNPSYELTFFSEPEAPDVYIIVQAMREIAANRYPEIGAEQMEWSYLVDGNIVRVTYSIE